MLPSALPHARHAPLVQEKTLAPARDLPKNLILCGLSNSPWREKEKRRGRQGRPEGEERGGGGGGGMKAHGKAIKSSGKNQAEQPREHEQQQAAEQGSKAGQREWRRRREKS